MTCSYNIKKVRSYLCFTGYYTSTGDYTGLCKIARPLNDLLVGHYTSKKNRNKRSKPVPFVWTERQHTSFDTLNEKLVKPPVLTYADYSKPFKIHMDANTTGLGAVLYQNQDGMDRVVAYACRGLKPSE